jgi:guanylate kinase
MSAAPTLDGNSFLGELRAARQARVFVLSGPSGVGKDSLIERLREYEPSTLFTVTATTRPQRSNEVDGSHYHFFTTEDFEYRLGNGEFLESAMVYGNRYGVLRRPVAEALAAGRDVVIKIDVKGAASIRERIPDSISIFLAPESMESLRDRLRYRKTESDEAIARRFEEATLELLRANEFDYVVFNETHGMIKAVQDVRAILQAARLKIAQPRIEL